MKNEFLIINPKSSATLTLVPVAVGKQSPARSRTQQDVEPAVSTRPASPKKLRRKLWRRGNLHHPLLDSHGAAAGGPGKRADKHPVIGCVVRLQRQIVSKTIRGHHEVEAEDAGCYAKIIQHHSETASFDVVLLADGALQRAPAYQAGSGCLQHSVQGLEVRHRRPEAHVVGPGVLINLPLQIAKQLHGRGRNIQHLRCCIKLQATDSNIAALCQQAFYVCLKDLAPESSHRGDLRQAEKQSGELLLVGHQGLDQTLCNKGRCHPHQGLARIVVHRVDVDQGVGRFGPVKDHLVLQPHERAFLDRILEFECHLFSVRLGPCLL
eukprot:m.160261 g.160261  ORF g.160261 m.160261 type:complete len:323 (+) comp17053_c0_seq15:3759-4727(+)